MTARWKHLVRMAVVLLLIGGVTTDCTWLKRMRQSPRQHWWEFWKPKRISSDHLAYPEDLVDIQPPPAPPILNGTGGIEPVPVPVDTVGPGPVVDPVDIVQPEPEPIRRKPAGMVTELQTVYFEFDQFRLTPEAVRILEGNAEFLLAHPELRVQIEGHCDERGTVEYNYQLGQRRADAVREYLIAKGVSPGQLNTISFGEERPAAPGSNEAAWQKNRRAQFQIY